MKAVRFHNYGSPDVLRIEDMPDPAIATNEILVRVVAAGVNPLDWKLRSGALSKAMPLALPAVPGLDVCGIVENPNGWPLKSGERVIGLTQPGRFGGYAECAVLTAAEIVRIPDRLDARLAAALPTIGLTAYHAVMGNARNRQAANGRRSAGFNLLVLGGAGMVGTLARQIAVQAGAEEIAVVVRRAQIDHLRGPVHVQLAAEDPDFAVLGRSVDLVIDTIGGPLQAQAMKTLTPGGRIVSTVQPPDMMLAKALGVSGEMVSLHADQQALADLVTRLDEGALDLPDLTVAPLDCAAEIHSAGERGNLAKAVLTP
jgi:NADPH:quinone reductase-like Zn-dependent oxidoreductase